MSVTHQITIWCDLCSRWEQATATAAQLWKELRGKGWTQIRHYYVRHYCPECSKKKAEILGQMKGMTPKEIEEMQTKRGEKR